VRGLPELLEQIRAQPFRIQEFLQAHARQLLDLLFRVIHAALVADARADLSHDLLDVDGVGANVEVSHRHTPYVVPAKARAATALTNPSVPGRSDSKRPINDHRDGNRPESDAREQWPIVQQ
jgi:hypothetical protein